MTGPPATILVVDDEAHNRKLLETLLKSDGYATRSAANGEAAMAAIALAAPDLVLLDIMMPVMDGYQVARMIKADPAIASIPIIMITALDDRGARLASLDAGVEEFLTKPVDRAELSLRVRNLLRMKTLGDFFRNHSVILEQEVRDRTSELQRFRSAMDSTADAITMVDRTTMRYIEINTTACSMFGYARDELLGMDPSQLVPASRADLARVFDGIIAGNAGGEAAELRFLRKDGSEFQGEERRHALRAGTNWIIVGVIRDVTERKRMEAARDRLAAILESTPDFVSISTAAEKIVYFNRAARVALGVGLDEDITEAMMANFIPDPASHPIVKEGIPTAVREGAWRGESLLLSRAGKEIPVSQVILAHKDAQGKLEYLSTIMRDITERKTAERSFKDLLEAAPDAMVLANARGEIALVNSQAVRLFGWSREELLGQSIEKLVPARFRGTGEESPGGFFMRPRTQPMGEVQPLTALRKDGSEFPAEVSQSPLETGDGTSVMSAIRDITDRRAAEHRIARLNRVYAMLSGINTLIVRVRDRDELFREACQLAVEHGKFTLAWIGIVDQNERAIVPIASAGSTGDPLSLVNQRFSVDVDLDVPPGNTVGAQATREKRVVVSNDMQSDPRVLFKEEHALRGSRSMAMLPLLVDDEVVGIFALYAGETGFFDDDEMKLLAELAGDIAFAIDHIGKQAKLDYLSYYDALTGLANRTLFLERVAQYVRGAERGGHRLGVFLVDLERFKNINDSLGQAAGDGLLRQVAEWLTHHGGDASLLARIGADHFALVLPQVKEPTDVARLIEKMLASIVEHPFRLSGSVFRVAAKVGAALYPDDGTDADSLLKSAESALKTAKASGEKYLFHAKAMTEKVAGKLSLENQLRRALDNGEFVLHYQPKVNLESGLLTGAEALIRWNDPQTGLVPPGRFIPVLEETGLIHEVGRWALREAIAEYLRWRATGLDAVRIAVNLSPMQLRNRGFVAEIKQMLGIDARAGAGLELELTESLLMEDVQHSITSLRAIRSLGVTIAIDDFGTGFSSLSYLARLSVDTLKIDRSFVTDMMAGPDGLALVSTIINLAHALSLTVVAEGVETEEQSHLLRLLKCDEMQGFLFSKPLPARDFEATFLAAPVAT